MEQCGTNMHRNKTKNTTGTNPKLQPEMAGMEKGGGGVMLTVGLLVHVDAEVLRPPPAARQRLHPHLPADKHAPPAQASSRS